MQNRGVASLLEYLRRELPLPGPELVPDGELLTRFTETKDEAAFELLVRRHGPMVFGVARRLVRNEHTAEDVLQATFLALARQATSLRNKQSIAAWLYRVAVRISLRARQRILVTAPIVANVSDDSNFFEQREVKTAIDSAIDRLPEKLRRAVVLCYVTGHTTEEAARLLGGPKGTILSRLAAARDKLQAELKRKGITVTAATLSAVLTNDLNSASLPVALVAIAMKAAGPTAALTPIVITLAQGAVAMSWMKTALALMFVLVIGLGTTLGIHRSSNKEQTQTNTRDSASVDLEREIDKQLQSASERRVTLKFKISQLRRKIEDLKLALDALRSLDGGPHVAGFQVLQSIDPEFVNSTIKAERLAPLPVMAKVIKSLEENELELMKVEEELRNHDEMAAIRLDYLKRKLLASTP